MAESEVELPTRFARARWDGVCVTYIQKKAGLSQSTISHYMGLLKDAGLVISKRHGQFTFYRRDEDAISAFVSEVGREFLKG